MMAPSRLKLLAAALAIALLIAGGLFLYRQADGGGAPLTGSNNSTIGFLNKSHPYLVFHDIEETPGYQNRGAAPWSGWESSVLRSADAALAYDYSKRWDNDYVSVRAGNARDLALAYHITKNERYAEKARQALLNMDEGKAPDPQKRMFQLLGYCLAYDWMQPYLSPADDLTARDKLATLADAAYNSLNGDNARRDYIATVDFHMQWYPIMGIAGVTLGDYKNPNGLPLRSMPEDWLRAGTDDLFVSDALHDYGKPLVSFQWDGAGKDLLGAYKMYYTDDFMWWAHVYTFYFGKNFFDAYPIAREAFTSEMWETLPNGYGNDFITNGNVIDDYQGAFISLLAGENRSASLYYLRSIDPKLLPYSREMASDGLAGDDFLYLTYRDYSGVPATPPAEASHLDNSSVYQVFRGSWGNDSEWLGFVTYDVDALSNRNNAHHDQLSFEYYGKGDVLLSDAGENRYALDKDHGAYEIDHNTIAVENPRRPFAPAPWSKTRARGIFKGSDKGLATPSNIRGILRAPWMEMVDANVSVAKVLNNNAYGGMALSSGIAYERCILFPGKEYFIVLDRLEGSEPWNYRTLFRPSSLDIVPTADKDGDGKYSEAEVGHVTGSLSIGGSPYDWLSLPYKSEASPGVSTSAVAWSTENPYGRAVELQVYTVPASEVRLEKDVSRAGGYNAQNEVFSPVVTFRTEPQKSLYRATVLLSSYRGEARATPSTLAVSGIGSAMRVDAPGRSDYIYTGSGASSFGLYSTDAAILFARGEGRPTEYTMVNGTFIDYGGSPLIKAPGRLSYVTVKQAGDGTCMVLRADRDMSIQVYAPSAPAITVDGVPMGAAITDTNNMVSIALNAGEHTVEIAA